jgi:hypothetical protein
MQSAGSLLKKMAFNKNAPESTKDAFIKHMQKALRDSEKAEVIPVERSPAQEAVKTTPPQQLCFDLDEVTSSATKKIG